MRTPKEEATLAEALRHPIRVRILEVLNQHDMSPTDFVKAGHASFHFGYEPSVDNVAYHFRELHEYGCLEAVAWRRGRGSVATIYRGVARDRFEGEDWTTLPESEKRRLSRAVAQGLIARIDGAMAADTFDSREDRHLSWFALHLDERGWQEVSDVLEDAFARIDRINDDAKARLSEQDDPGVAATAGLLLFESPDAAPARS